MDKHLTNLIRQLSKRSLVGQSLKPFLLALLLSLSCGALSSDRLEDYQGQLVDIYQQIENRTAELRGGREAIRTRLKRQQAEHRQHRRTATKLGEQINIITVAFAKDDKEVARNKEQIKALTRQKVIAEEKTKLAEIEIEKIKTELTQLTSAEGDPTLKKLFAEEAAIKTKIQEALTGNNP